MKKEEKKKKDNIEKLGKVLEEKKKIPKSVKEKINGVVFENMAIAAVFMIYLVALNLGMSNIPTDTYIMDLKVFSITLLVISIIVFEFGYKKDSGYIWLHGVEITIIAIFTLYLVYLYTIYYATFGTVVLSMGILYLIYYAVKIVIIQRKYESEYNKTLTDINEIVKK